MCLWQKKECSIIRPLNLPLPCPTALWQPFHLVLSLLLPRNSPGCLNIANLDNSAVSNDVSIILWRRVMSSIILLNVSKMKICFAVPCFLSSSAEFKACTQISLMISGSSTSTSSNNCVRKKVMSYKQTDTGLLGQECIMVQGKHFDVLNNCFALKLLQTIFNDFFFYTISKWKTEFLNIQCDNCVVKQGWQSWYHLP